MELFFSSRRRHTRYWRDWSSDVCSSDLVAAGRGHRQLGGLSRGGGAGGRADRHRRERGDHRHPAAAPRTGQIGRGACRERGEISGGGREFKKKRKSYEKESPHVIQKHTD